jgi:hypothetical protein
VEPALTDEVSNEGFCRGFIPPTLRQRWSFLTFFRAREQRAAELRDVAAACVTTASESPDAGTITGAGVCVDVLAVVTFATVATSKYS